MAKLSDVLTRAIIPVFGRLGVPQQELLTGPINHTNLAWQTPPIICDAVLAGIPLWEILDIGLAVDAPAFCAFYTDVAAMLRNQTKEVLNMHGYKGLGSVVRASPGERLFWLSVPEGSPANMTEYAGALFNMECAQVMRQAGHAKEFFSTEDDFYVVTHSGYEIGIKDGLPLAGTLDWDTSVKGLVHDLLRLPRGDVFEGCDYDLICKLRSTLWDNREKVSATEFEAADMALQGLRLVAQGSSIPALQRGVLEMRKVANISASRLDALRQAAKIVPLLALSDRQKITTLREILVPACLGKGAFSKAVYPYHRDPPAMLPVQQMRRIAENIEVLIRHEENKNAN